VTRYTSDSRDRVLDAVDMVSLVSARTEMRRHGVNSYFGLCPFHDERTPSFHVRPDEKHYHCFGCQASGDPFDFVMQTDGVDFKEALEALAGRFGVKLETEAEDPAAASRRERRDRERSRTAGTADAERPRHRDQGGPHLGRPFGVVGHQEQEHRRGAQDGDHRFLALFGKNNNLDPSLLNIENRVCYRTLRKNDLVLAKFQYGFALADLGEEGFRIERARSFRRHDTVSPGCAPDASRLS